MNNRLQRSWKQLFLKYLDINDNDHIDWWEIVIAVSVILGVEITADFVSALLYGILW